VHFRAQAEAMPAFAALEADPAKAILPGQLAHGNLQRFACFIEFQTDKVYHNGTPHNNNFARRNFIMTESVFRHTHRVVYAECTLGDHVYHSRYLDMLERARGEFLRKLGRPALQWQEAGIVFPVIAVEISYKSPARYDDLLSIELWVAEMGGVRLNVGFRILNGAGALLAEGVTRHVCATTEEKPTRLPKELMESLRPFLRAAAQ
jgi:acyl-CoA thioester hydrolase